MAAAAWGILAFGDGMASVAGMSLGRRKLPWNPRKSWMGSLAYVLFGTLAAAVLLVWTAPDAGASRTAGRFALAACLATALLAAALESLPQGLDDNLGVPLVSGLFLLGLVLTQGHWGAFLADPGLPVRLADRRRRQRGARRRGLRGAHGEPSRGSSPASWWGS